MKETCGKWVMGKVILEMKETFWQGLRISSYQKWRVFVELGMENFAEDSMEIGGTPDSLEKGTYVALEMVFCVEVVIDV